MLSDDLLRASGYFIKKAYKASKFTIYAAGAFIAASLALVTSPILICCCGNLVKGDLFGKGDGVGIFLGCVILGIVVPVVAIPVLPIVAVGSLALGIGTGVLGIASWMVEKICCCGARDANAPREREDARLLSRRERAEAEARQARQQEAQRVAEAREQERRAQRAEQQAAQIREWEQRLEVYRRDEQRQQQRSLEQQLQQQQRETQERARLALAVLPSAPVLLPTPSAPPAPYAFIQRVAQEVKSEIFQPAPVERKAIPVLKAPLTPEQMKLMTDKLTPETEALFLAAAEDNIVMLTQMLDPVFISDGNNYDRQTATGLLKEQGGECPSGRQSFKEEDIVPNNTLAEAMLFAIKDIELEKKGENIKEDDVRLCDDYRPFLRAKAEEQRKKENKDDCLSNDDIAVLEQYYHSLSPRQKQIFNIMCRDRFTGLIFKNPVFLRCGYVYERSVVDEYCKSRSAGEKGWPCPKNIEVKFTSEQILKCFSARNVLDVLKAKVPQIKQQIEVATQAQGVRRMTAA